MSAPIRVAIRADAGTALGTGHFARASAVADALAAAGGTEVMLVTGEEGAALVPAYFPSGISVVALKPGNTDPASTRGTQTPATCPTRNRAVTTPL